MNKSKLFDKKQFNKGYSLVEVLVAMLILAVVTVPLLMAFTLSARMNAKAKIVQFATVAAQTIMEEFKNSSMENLANQYEADPNSSVTVTLGTPNSYSFAKNNISVGTVNYNVEIEAVGGSNTIEFEPVLFSTTKDYAFVQDNVSNKNIFSMAYPKALTLINSYNPKDGSGNYIYGEILGSDINSDIIHTNRTICIKIEADGSGVKVSEEVKYEGVITNFFSNAHFTIPTANRKYDIDTLTINPSGKHYDDLENIFIFYYPAYSRGIAGLTNCEHDEIKVENSTSNTDKYHVYILKQKCPEYTDSLLYERENAYTPYITVSGIDDSNIHTNLKMNLSKLWHEGDLVPPGANSVPGNPNIYDRSINVLNYKLKIKVYDPSSGDLLYEMEGSTNSSKDKK